MNELNLGSYSLPVLLMVLMALIFRVSTRPDGTSSISDQIKPILAVIVGITLGILGLLNSGKELILPNITDYVLYGFMQGAAAVGIYEVTKTVKFAPPIITPETGTIETKK